MDALFQQCFEEQIHALANGLTKKGCTKQYDKVLRRVGLSQEKYAQAAQYFTIEVGKDPDSNLATKLHFVSVQTLKKRICWRVLFAHQHHGLGMRSHMRITTTAHQR